MEVEVICIKTCVSDKYHIIYENEKYIIYGSRVKIPFPKKEGIIPKINIYDTKGNFLGGVNIKNILTLAEYRDTRIDEILN